MVSAALTVWLGPRAAQTLGIVKELRDSRSDSGFSYADLSADLAGIAFALGVRSSSPSLESLSGSFTIGDFFPTVDDLEEGIPWKTFTTGPRGHRQR